VCLGHATHQRTPTHTRTCTLARAQANPVTLFVGNLSDTLNDRVILELLNLCGVVLKWDRVRGPSMKLQAFGYCSYVNPEHALRTLRILNNYELGGKQIRITADEKSRAMLDEYLAARRRRGAVDENGLDENTRREDAIALTNIEANLKRYGLLKAAQDAALAAQPQPGAAPGQPLQPLLPLRPPQPQFDPLQQQQPPQQPLPPQQQQPLPQQQQFPPPPGSGPMAFPPGPPLPPGARMAAPLPPPPTDEPAHVTSEIRAFRESMMQAEHGKQREERDHRHLDTRRGRVDSVELFAKARQNAEIQRVSGEDELVALSTRSSRSAFILSQARRRDKERRLQEDSFRDREREWEEHERKRERDVQKYLGE
jgi:hypothetical protein